MCTTQRRWHTEQNKCVKKKLRLERSTSTNDRIVSLSELRMITAGAFVDEHRVMDWRLSH